MMISPGNAYRVIFLAVVLAIALPICGGSTVILIAKAMLIRPSPLPLALVSQGPTVTALQGLEELVTVRIQIADVLTASDGRYSGAWLIKGDALVAVDLLQATFEESLIDLDQRTAVLCLPLPRIIQARLDHERTKTWDVKRVTWVPYSGNPDRLRDAAMLEAQKLVEHAASQADCINQAKTRAETLVTAIYGKLGWTVTVRWLSQSPARIPSSTGIERSSLPNFESLPTG